MNLRKREKSSKKEVILENYIKSEIKLLVKTRFIRRFCEGLVMRGASVS